VPLAGALTGGNRNDVTQPLLILHGSTPNPGKVGRLHQRSDRIVADRGYDSHTMTTTTHDGSYGSGQGGNTVTRSKG
jgi:hypothetical protein